jgi:hypothetical protein
MSHFIAIMNARFASTSGDHQIIDLDTLLGVRMASLYINANGLSHAHWHGAPPAPRRNATHHS